KVPSTQARVCQDVRHGSKCFVKLWQSYNIGRGDVKDISESTQTPKINILSDFKSPETDRSQAKEPSDPLPDIVHPKRFKSIVKNQDAQNQLQITRLWRNILCWGSIYTS
ncbi:unnamed protein product, partial [Owenia fusiformis]